MRGLFGSGTMESRFSRSTAPPTRDTTHSPIENTCSRQASLLLARRVNSQGREEPFDKAIYRKRNIIERMIGWLKRYRRVATRFDKLAVSFRATIQVAIMLFIMRMPF